jgi:hypothetical protein
MRQYGKQQKLMRKNAFLEASLLFFWFAIWLKDDMSFTKIILHSCSANFVIALDTNGVEGEFFFMYIDKYIEGVGLFHTDVIGQKLFKELWYVLFI